MPARTMPLVTGEYYHVFNRGVAYLPTFSSIKDYERFLFCLLYYRYKDIPFKLSRLLHIQIEEREKILKSLEIKNDKIIDVLSYCLMPNHFHLLLQQKADGGISKYIKHVSDSYIRYFNMKRKRVGPLFQGAFKAVHIETDEQLIHLSRYIHLNPLVSFVVKKENFLSYPWISLQAYYNERQQRFVNPTPILERFKSGQEYLQFVLDQADYGKELEKIKHLKID